MKKQKTTTANDAHLAPKTAPTADSHMAPMTLPPAGMAHLNQGASMPATGCGCGANGSGMNIAGVNE